MNEKVLTTPDVDDRVELKEDEGSWKVITNFYNGNYEILLLGESLKSITKKTVHKNKLSVIKIGPKRRKDIEEYYELKDISDMKI